MKKILSQELRDRAQSVTSRIESDTQAKQDEEERKKAELNDLAIEEFRQLFKTVVSDEVIQSLNIRLTKNSTGSSAGWRITKGECQDKYSRIEPFAQIKLPYNCFIKISCPNQVASQWKIIQPQLNARKDKWTQQDPFKYIDLEKASVEEAILIALLDFERDAQEYEDTLEQQERDLFAKEAEVKQRQLEHEAFLAQVKATDAEIQKMIDQAITPYNTQWTEGFILQVYKWRYCTGAADGEFDYDEVYSLSPHLDYDKRLDKSFIEPIEGDRISIDMEIHKPVVYEIVCDSLESVQNKLGRIGVCERQSFALPGIGYIEVDKDYLSNRGVFYFCWKEDGNATAWSEKVSCQAMPWLRKLLGLPELPQSIHIQKP